MGERRKELLLYCVDLDAEMAGSRLAYVLRKRLGARVVNVASCEEAMERCSADADEDEDEDARIPDAALLIPTDMDSGLCGLLSDWLAEMGVPQVVWAQREFPDVFAGNVVRGRLGGVVEALQSALQQGSRAVRVCDAVQAAEPGRNKQQETRVV